MLKSARPRVLIVEDDALLAFDLKLRLERVGFRIVGPTALVADALKLIRCAGCDTAVLDINLGRNNTSEPIARELAERGIPFLTVTGYSHAQRPAAFDGAPHLAKPVRTQALVTALHATLDGWGPWL